MLLYFVAYKFIGIGIIFTFQPTECQSKILSRNTKLSWTSSQTYSNNLKKYYLSNKYFTSFISLQNNTKKTLRSLRYILISKSPTYMFNKKKKRSLWGSKKNFKIHLTKSCKPHTRAVPLKSLSAYEF